MVAGPEPLLTNVLASLQGKAGWRWIRSRSPRAAEYGFAWLDDLRYHNPRISRPPEKLPGDLFDVYWFARTNLHGLPGKARAFEVWNEPDFHFVEDSAASMAAVLKAAWWGLKRVRPDTPVLMPSLAFRPSRYALELAHNGLHSWTAGLNAHFYGWAADFHPFLAHHRAFAKAMDFKGPWWLTEVGYFQLPASAATEPDSLARQAAFHERTMVESWVAGVDHHLFFSITPHVEAGSDMGLMDSRGRWRPAMNSITRLAAALPGSVPRWFIIHKASGATTGVVLEQPDLTWWSILWSPGRPGETSAPDPDAVRTTPERLRLHVQWPKQISEVRAGIQGDVVLDPVQLRTVDLTPENVLHLRTAPHRYHLENCRWVRPSRVPGSEPTIFPRARRELRTIPPQSRPSPVVLRFRPESPFKPDKPSQTLRLPTGEFGKATLEFHNFSDGALRGSWTADVPPGWTLDSSPPTALSGEHGSHRVLHVPAKTRVAVALRMAHHEANSEDPGRLTLAWRGDDGSSDVVSVRLEREPQPGFPWFPFGWRDFVPRPEFAAAWQVFETAPGHFTLEIREPVGNQRDAVLYLPLPKGIRATDAFTTAIRSPRHDSRVFVQAFLLTGNSEVWRYGEWEQIPADGLSLRARLGDFSPTIWSRHRTFLFPPVHKARWLALRFQGLEAGQLVELEEPSIRR
jgi:hypothetical protein